MSGIFDFLFSEHEAEKEFKKFKKEKIREMLNDDEKREKFKQAVKKGLKDGITEGIKEYKRFFDFANEHEGCCSIKTASRLLGVSVQRVHEFIREGRLETESFFEGRRILITGDSLLKFIDDRKPPHRPKKKDK